MKKDKEKARIQNREITKELLTKSVSKRFAQTINVCEKAKAPPAEWLWIEEKAKALKQQNPELGYIFMLQYSGGLRISEVLSIKLEDIARDYSIRIKALKQSESRIISGECIKDYLSECKKANCQPFMNFNRFFIYRAYKKAGIFFRAQSSTKASITHAPRHLKAQSLKEANFTNNEVGTVLGHRNKKNTERYGK